MDDFSSESLGATATNRQKSLRLDAFAARLASTRAAASAQPPSHSHNSVFCIECGEMSDGQSGSVCQSCASGTAPAPSAPLNAICYTCNTQISNMNSVRCCTSCKKYIHRDCDRADCSILDDYVCHRCRRSPLVGDAMLPAPGPASPLASVSHVSEQLNGALEDLAGVTRRDSQEMDTDTEFYPLPSQHHPSEELSNGIPSPATTSDSRNSPAFYSEKTPSDDEDEFKPPGGYTPRGRGRGGGGAKKKPGRGQMKTRSGGKPPTGSTRGKRGKGSRGAYKQNNGKGKGTRGRRGRGQLAAAATQSVLHHLQNAYSQVREVDQTLVEEMEQCKNRNDDGEYIRTAVVFDAEDQFMKEAHICLVCGSVGRGEECSFVACMNCAQTYHTYCVGIHNKMRDTIVTRGWRCLDCTVCEGCGEGRDESNLLLCEECDTAFHIYCLNPPLTSIPTEAWRCQWCARCRRCNIRVSSGKDLTREGLCHACYSLRKCPKCVRLYQVGDQIIRCSACAKWYHGRCEGLLTPEEMETAAANKMRCSSCRPQGTDLRGNDSGQLLLVDNVCLHRASAEIFNSPNVPPQMRSAVNEYANGGDIRSISFDQFLSFDDDELQQEIAEVSSGRGRMRGPGRRVSKLGVGGFFVRGPKQRLLTTEEEEEENQKKLQKRPRKPRRCQMEDAYPPAIQEGFFGIRPVEGKQLLDVDVDEPILCETGVAGRRNMHEGNQLSQEATEALKNDLTEAYVLENLEIDDFNIDEVDFSNFMGDDEDDDFNDLDVDNDSLNDAISIVQRDGFDPETLRAEEASRQSITSNSSSTQFPSSSGAPVPVQPSQPHQYNSLFGTGPASVSRTSSTNDAVEKEKCVHTAGWEEDEPLGEKSTKAAVLFVNVNKPHLKQQYPDWNDRVKQIQKCWRQLDGENRQKYVTLARENRQQRGRVPRQRKVQPQPQQQPVVQQVPVPSQHPNGPQQMPPEAMQPGMAHPQQMLGQNFKVPPVPPGGQVPVGPDGQPLPHQFITVKQEGGYVNGGPPPHPMQMQHPMAHLNPEILHKYQLLKDRAADLSRLQERIETELNKMRKQKKNLAAKRRQLQKSDVEGRPPSELSDTDRVQLDQLTEGIPGLQRDLESCKRDTKTHQQMMGEFEQKHGIQPELLNRMQLQGIVPGMQRPPQFPPGQAPAPGMYPPGHPAYHQMRGVPPHQMPYAMGAHPVMPASMHMQMRPSHFPRSPCLGSGRFVYEKLESPLDREIYECVDDLLSQVTIMVEGREVLHRDRDSVMLKRMLEPNQLQAGPSHLHHAQLAHMQMGHHPSVSQPLVAPTSEPDQPPRKKKRAQVKKAGANSANDAYDALVQRVTTQLGLCEKMPRRSLESTRSRGYLLPEPGISDLPGNIAKDQKAVVGERVGSIELTFMDDIYSQKASTSKCNQMPTSYPTMSDVAPNVDLEKLTQARPPSPCEYVRDEVDLVAHTSCSDLISRICQAVRRKPNSLHIRQANKLPDALPPMDPLRSTFKLMPSLPEDVEVCIVVRENELGGELGAVKVKQEEVVRACFHAPTYTPAVMAYGDKISNPIFTDNESRIAEDSTKYICFFPPDVDHPEPTSTRALVQSDNPIRALFDRLSSLLKVEQKFEYSIDTPPLSPREENGVERGFSRSHSVHLVGGGKCRACDSLMETAAVQQSISKLGLTPSDDGKDDTVYFCSMKCYYSFVASKKVALSPDQLVNAESHADEETLSRLKQISAENFAKSIQGKVKLEQASAPVMSDSIVQSPKERIPDEKKEHFTLVRVADLVASMDPNAQRQEQSGPQVQEWTVFSPQILDTFLRIQRHQKELAQCRKLGIEPVLHLEMDKRKCVLCGIVGDGDQNNVYGRLLNLDAALWVHLSCAIWSADVYENPQGGLHNVDKTVLRSLQVMCHLCGGVGASLQCIKADCLASFHFPCAKRIGGKFIRDRTLVCPKHHDVSMDVILQSPEIVRRRVYIERDENVLLGKMFDPAEHTKLTLRLGSLTFVSQGQLLPEQLKTFHNMKYIFPMSFHVIRYFWHPSDPRLRVPFDCSITEKEGKPWFIVKFKEAICEGPTATHAWQKILDGVKNARERIDCLRFFPSQIVPEQLYGLTEPAITKITESLPGVDSLYTYTFRHGGAPILELPLAENPSGCARCEFRCRTLVKTRNARPMPSAGPSSASRSSGSCSEGRTRGAPRARPTYDQELAAAQMQRMLSASGIGAEWAAAMMLGRMGEQSNNIQVYSAYQKMKKEWKNTVYLARSKIQGLGLYAKRDIDMGAMIIEYKGELIRSEVGEMREKRYVAQNRGVYMFRIDEELIVDATMAGGCARYINHSCDPNCSTRIIHIGSQAEDKKIIITANRPIKALEELTYDYQFDVEDETKIACLCGAPNCQKWMN